MTAVPARGLYAITDTRAANGASLLDAVRAAVTGGAAMVQYRDKGSDRARRLAEVRQLLDLCRNACVPLIVNDDIALAAEAGADGVHLGRDDGTVQTARAALGEHAIIGVSCYNDASRALAAQQAGADYLAFGRFFPSGSKPEAVAAEPALLREIRARTALPIVAIGGITPANGAILLDAGADLLAVIGAVFGQPDPGAAARAFAPLFRQSRSCEEAS